MRDILVIFLLVSFCGVDGSWQNWDCNTNARRPSTYESKLCCSISLFSDVDSGLFKIYVKERNVGTGFWDSPAFKDFTGGGTDRGGEETLTAAEGCAAQTYSMWLLHKIMFSVCPVSAGGATKTPQYRKHDLFIEASLNLNVVLHLSVLHFEPNSAYWVKNMTFRRHLFY